MKRPSKFPSVVHTTFAVVTFCYAVIGGLGYLAYGTEMHNHVKGKSGEGERVIHTLITVLIAVTSTSKFTLAAYPLTKRLIDSVLTNEHFKLFIKRTRAVHVLTSPSPSVQPTSHRNNETSSITSAGVKHTQYSSLNAVDGDGGVGVGVGVCGDTSGEATICALNGNNKDENENENEEEGLLSHEEQSGERSPSPAPSHSSSSYPFPSASSSSSSSSSHLSTADCKDGKQREKKKKVEKGVQKEKEKRIAMDRGRVRVREMEMEGEGEDTRPPLAAFEVRVSTAIIGTFPPIYMSGSGSGSGSDVCLHHGDGKQQQQQDQSDFTRESRESNNNNNTDRNTLNSSHHHPLFFLTVKFILRAMLPLCALFVSWIITDFIKLMGLIGSIFGLLISFIIPLLCYRKIFRKEIKLVENIFILFLIFFGSTLGGCAIFFIFCDDFGEN